MRRVVAVVVAGVAVLCVSGCAEQTTVTTCSGPDAVERTYARADAEETWTLTGTRVIPFGCVQR
jgi:type IV pilus biogenesis protein CpaD/CtpE